MYKRELAFFFEFKHYVIYGDREMQLRGVVVWVVVKKGGVACGNKCREMSQLLGLSCVGLLR